MMSDPSATIVSTPRHAPPLADSLRFVVGAACGVALGILAQVLLSLIGLDIAAVWRGLFVAGADQSRAALAWWGIAGIAFVGSYAAARSSSTMLSRSWVFRWLRWIGALAALVGLAIAGQFVSTPGGGAANGRLAANLVAMALAAVMAFAGAFLAMRR